MKVCLALLVLVGLLSLAAATGTSTSAGGSYYYDEDNDFLASLPFSPLLAKTNAKVTKPSKTVHVKDDVLGGLPFSPVLLKQLVKKPITKAQTTGNVATRTRRGRHTTPKRAKKNQIKQKVNNDYTTPVLVKCLPSVRCPGNRRRKGRQEEVDGTFTEAPKIVKSKQKEPPAVKPQQSTKKSSGKENTEVTFDLPKASSPITTPPKEKTTSVPSSSSKTLKKFVHKVIQQTHRTQPTTTTTTTTQQPSSSTTLAKFARRIIQKVMQRSPSSTITHTKSTKKPHSTPAAISSSMKLFARKLIQRMNANTNNSNNNNNKKKKKNAIRHKKKPLLRSGDKMMLSTNGKFMNCKTGAYPPCRLQNKGTTIMLRKALYNRARTGLPTFAKKGTPLKSGDVVIILTPALGKFVNVDCSCGGKFCSIQRWVGWVRNHAHWGSPHKIRKAGGGVIRRGDNIWFERTEGNMNSWRTNKVVTCSNGGCGCTTKTKPVPRNTMKIVFPASRS